METILNQIEKAGVVSVVRGDTLQEGLEISQACIRGGISMIEVTFTNAYAKEIIRTLNEDDARQGICIGAGTVLTRKQAQEAYEAGAKFIVSPAFTQEVSDYCRNNHLVYIPGCMTVTEIVNAMNAGHTMIKLFPGSAFGPSYVKSMKSPLPDVRIMVTGGVNLNNMREWFKAGVQAIGVGGEFNQLGSQGQFAEIENMAKQYTQVFKEMRA